MNSFLLINPLPNTGCVLVQAGGSVSEQDIHCQPQRRAGAGAREDQHLLVSIVHPRCDRRVVTLVIVLTLEWCFTVNSIYLFNPSVPIF